MQFLRDLEAVAALVEKHIRGGSSALRTVMEGARLLALPVEVEGGLGLREVSNRVFTDGEQARGVLGELGLGLLGPATARIILQRRVENEE